MKGKEGKKGIRKKHESEVGDIRKSSKQNQDKRNTRQMEINKRFFSSLLDTRVCEYGTQNG